jgi:hypothetical protein
MTPTTPRRYPRSIDQMRVETLMQMFDEGPSDGTWTMDYDTARQVYLLFPRSQPWDARTLLGRPVDIVLFTGKAILCYQ